MCKMSGRAVAACVALFALNFTSALAQDNAIYVKVSDSDHNDHEEIEHRMTPELVRDLKKAQSDALLLYTEYTGKAGSDMKTFLQNISEYTDEALRAVQQRPSTNRDVACQRQEAV